MIASALRTEMERSTSRMRSGHPPASGAPPSGARGAFGDLIAPANHIAARLAHRAYFLHLAVENGLSFIRMLEERAGLPCEALGFVGLAREECRDRMEEALDALDALVEDPAQLPALRDELRAVIAQVARLTAEPLHTERKHDLHVSAA